LKYCISLCYNIKEVQINRFQEIENSLARVVIKPYKSTHMTYSLQVSSALA